MKKTILLLAGVTLITSATLVSCHTPPIATDTTQGVDSDSTKVSDKLTQAYIADIDKYRLQIADSVDVNEKCISTCTDKISKDNRASREVYKKRTDALKQKNSDMKKNMEEYQADGKEKWEKFKVDFDHNMSELDKSIRNLRDSIM
jgi:hypothetical protein